MVLIDEAVITGARRFKACAKLWLSVRTVQRWQHQANDGRPLTQRPAPANLLSEAERAQVLAVLNEPAHASLLPHQVVPMLVDHGGILAAESMM